MTPRRLLATLVLALATTPALAAWDVAQLMTELARNRGGQALFTEKKYIALLDKPVISSGEMRYTAPDYLEKRTLLPRPCQAIRGHGRDLPAPQLSPQGRGDQ